MKTGGIFTMALTNPKAKFKSIGQQFGDHVAHFNAVGKLVDEEGELVFPTYDMDWELVPQEVTWQEAIQAWVEHKDIRIEYNGELFSQPGICRLGCFAKDHDGFNKELFEKGKWYIE